MLRPRPATAAQMHASMQCGGEPCVTSHHERQAAGAADAGEIAAKRRSIRIIVVPQDDARKTAWEPSHGWPGVGQAARVGKQPERGNIRATATAGARPSHQLAIHRAASSVCANRSVDMSKRKHAIEAYFQSGLRLHRAGRLQEAEQVYRQVLAASPAHADSLHMLGVIATQCGQPEAALSCFDQAIALKPSVAMFHVNRAAALLALRQLDAALAACQQALRLKRNCAEAYQVMGHVLSDLGRPEEAVAAHRDALRHRTDLPDGHNNLGLALRQAGCLEEGAGGVASGGGARAGRPRGAGQFGQRPEGTGAARRGRGVLQSRTAASIQTIPCCTSIWGLSFCWPEDLRRDGRNMSGGSAPAPRRYQPARSPVGTAMTLQDAGC